MIKVLLILLSLSFCLAEGISHSTTLVLISLFEVSMNSIVMGQSTTLTVRAKCSYSGSDGADNTFNLVVTPGGGFSSVTSITVCFIIT